MSCGASATRLPEVCASGSAASIALKKSLLIAISNLQDGVDVFDIQRGCNHLFKLPTPVGALTNVRLQVAFAEKGAVLVTGTDQGLIKVWDLRNGRLLQALAYGR